MSGGMRTRAVVERGLNFGLADELRKRAVAERGMNSGLADVLLWRV
jgi:hypothetical protein